MSEQKENNGKILPLKKMPEDVRKIILRVQYEMKVKRGTSQFSLPTTIYAIIREYDKNTKAISSD